MKAKKGEVQQILEGAKLTDEQFKDLVALTSKINDYVNIAEAPTDTAPDDQNGVAVILDRESEDVCYFGHNPKNRSSRARPDVMSLLLFNRRTRRTTTTMSCVTTTNTRTRVMMLQWTVPSTPWYVSLPHCC